MVSSGAASEALLLNGSHSTSCSSDNARLMSKTYIANRLHEQRAGFRLEGEVPPSAKAATPGSCLDFSGKGPGSTGGPWGFEGLLADEPAEAAAEAPDVEAVRFLYRSSIRLKLSSCLWRVSTWK